MRSSKEQSNDLSRRAFIGGAGVVAIGSLGALAGCAGSSDSASGSAAAPSNAAQEDMGPWDKETDIVVVGSGAGLFAAIEAADAGSNVILLEKSGILGGMTAVNESWTTASGSKVQAENGVVDSGEAHWKNWLEVHAEIVPIADLDFCKQYVMKSGEAIDRLVDLGMEFTVFREPVTHEVARAHMGQPNARAWVTVLEPVATEKGVEILTETPAEKLIVDSLGMVCGVVAKDKNENAIRIKANKAVILAAGDCANDDITKEKFFSEEVNAVPACITSNTGDGLRMAKAIGADSSEGFPGDGNQIMLDVGLYPEPLPLQKGAILVNKEGKRFTDETGTPYLDTMKQTDTTSFTIFGKELADLTHRGIDGDKTAEDNEAGKTMCLTLISGVGMAYLEDLQEHEGITEASSIAELAEAIEVDGKNLAETIEKWNASVSAGTDDEFGRSMLDNIGNRYGSTVPIATPPFYAMKSSRCNKLMLDGPNLLVTLDMEVKDVYGESIPRLYACGAAMTVGNVAYANHHGEHMTVNIVSARIAADKASQLEAWG